MAERRQIQQRMLNPSNPMSFSKQLSSPQTSTYSQREKQAFAEAISQLGSGFAQAFGAKAKVDHAEKLRQDKIDEAIRKQQASAEEIRGKAARKRRGVLTPMQLKMLGDENFQRGYQIQHYQLERDNKNLYIKNMSKQYADNVYSTYSALKKEGQINLPLEEYASIFVEKERTRLLEGFKGPVADGVIAEKGLNFDPFHDAMANLLVQEQQATIDSMVQKRTMEMVIANNPQTNKDFTQLVELATIPTQQYGSFVPRGKIVNEYLRQVETLLDKAEDPNDPVFNMMNMVNTVTDGVGITRSRDLSENRGFTYVGEHASDLYNRLLNKRRQLKERKDSEAKSAKEKNDNKLRAESEVFARSMISEIQPLTARGPLLAIQRKWASEASRKNFKVESKDEDLTYAGIGKLIATKLKDATSVKLPGDMVEDFNNIKQRIVELTSKVGTAGFQKGDREEQNTVLYKTNFDDQINALTTEASETFGKYDEYESIIKLTGKLREDHEKRRQALKDELRAQFKAEKQKRFKENLVDTEDRFLRLKRTHDTLSEADFNVELKQIESFISKNKLDDDVRKLNGELNEFLINRADKNKSATFEENGIKFYSEIQNIIADGGDQVIDKIDDLLVRMGKNVNVLSKDRKKVLDLAFNKRKEVALEQLEGKERDEYIRLYNLVTEQSENKEELQKLIDSGQLNKSPDAREKAQAYIDRLNNREYEDRVYGQRKAENIALWEERYERRKKEEERVREQERAFRKAEKEADRIFNRFVRNQDLQEKRRYQENRDRKKQEAREEHAKKMADLRFANAIKLRKEFAKLDQQKYSKRQGERQEAIEVAFEFIEKFQSADEKERKKILGKFNKNETLQKKLKQDTSMYELVRKTIANTGTEQTLMDRSAQNQKIALQSIAKQQQRGIEVGSQIERILENKNPDLDRARALLAEKVEIFDYDSSTGKIIPIQVSVFGDGVSGMNKALEYHGKLRIEAVRQQEKTQAIQSRGLEAEQHIKFENMLQNFPEQDPEESDQDYLLAVNNFKGVFWNDLADQYEKGNIDEGTFNQLKNDINALVENKDKGKIVKSKLLKDSPYKIFSDKIRDYLTNPNTFYPAFKYESLMGKAEHRRKLYADILADYRNSWNQYALVTPGFLDGDNSYQLQYEYTEGLFNTLMYERYKERIDAVFNKNFLGGDTNETAVETSITKQQDRTDNKTESDL